jgi:hypothetical protein
MRRQGTQGLKKRSLSEAKYLVFEVFSFVSGFFFLLLLGRESTLEQACL